jgi:hypothetical protein
MTLNNVEGRRISRQVARYDRLLSGRDLSAVEARDLRALARVFDVEAASGEGLPALWLRLRPLIEDAGAGCGPIRPSSGGARPPRPEATGSRSKAAVLSSGAGATTGWSSAAWPSR